MEDREHALESVSALAGDFLRFLEGAMVVGSCRLSKEGLYINLLTVERSPRHQYTREVFQAQREVSLNVVAMASLGMPFPAD